jgi:hypothetical protein
MNCIDGISTPSLAGILGRKPAGTMNRVRLICREQGLLARLADLP